MSSSNDVKTYDAEFWWYLSGFAVLSVVACAMPYALTQHSVLSLGINKPNEIGDSIGGTLGPFVALLAAALTFFAFWVQYKANQQQRSDIKVERFESKFYEMIGLHNEIVKEISITGRHVGRESFVHLFNEYRFTYQVIEQELNGWNSRAKSDSSIAKLNYSKAVLAEFAYIMFFFGIGEQSSKATIFTNTVHAPFYTTVQKELRVLQQKFNRSAGIDSQTIVYVGSKPIVIEIDYRPFDGHVSRLGHYYRHLYQIVKFVDFQKNPEDLYFFTKTIRSQLSNHEQLLLYYNSFFAKQWWEERLFIQSRIIKNIPLYLADVGPTPEESFTEEFKKINSKISDEQLKVEISKQLEWSAFRTTVR